MDVVSQIVQYGPVFSIVSTVLGAMAVLFGAMASRRLDFLRVSQERSQRLWLLVTEKNWADMHPLALQIACQPLFGVLAHADIIFGLERQDPMGYLGRRRRARWCVKLDGKSGEHGDGRGSYWSWIPYGFLSRVCMAVAMVTLLIGGGAILLLFAAGMIAGGVLWTLNTFVFFAWLCIGASQFDAAAELLAAGAFPRANGESVLTTQSPEQKAKEPQAIEQVMPVPESFAVD